ncbi:hypothetical protein [Trinickia fusca]|nr:hypothetical protein [Trinickia fusca]
MGTIDRPDAAGRLSGDPASVKTEAELHRLRTTVHTLLQRGIGESGDELDELQLALAAYDAGIARRFYGRDSSIAHGLRMKFESMLRAAADTLHRGPE